MNKPEALDRSHDLVHDNRGYYIEEYKLDVDGYTCKGTTTSKVFKTRELALAAFRAGTIKYK